MSKTRTRAKPTPPQDGKKEAMSDKERVQACGQAIAEALQKYGCKLTAVPSLVPDGIGGFRLVIGQIGCSASD